MSSTLTAVEEIYKQFGQGNFAAALALLSPEIVWTERVPYQGTATSRDEIRALFEYVTANFDWGMHFDHFVDGGEIVVVIGTYSWRTKPAAQTEPQTHARFCHVWWAGEDGLIARYEQFVDSIKGLGIIELKTLAARAAVTSPRSSES
jgi:ketosteroid isomerase-like protein